MGWLKRNWLLIVTGVVALGLLAGAVVYLLAQQQSSTKAATELKTAQEELSRLRNFSPSLDDANIQKVQEEITWFKGYVPQVHRLLEADTNTVTKLDTLAFKSLLENTIAALNAEAESAGVTLRAKYSFTFETQRPMVQFPSNTIPVLAGQLYEIKELCEILLRSKVHSLEGLKRVKAYPEEPSGADYLEGKSIVTNGPVIITPYEVTFRGFTPELSQVLDALQRSKVFFTVKRMTVLALEVAQPVDLLPPAPVPTPGGKAPPDKGKGKAAPAQPTLQTIMDEKPLRVTLALEVVKLAPADPSASAAAPPAAAPPVTTN